VGISGLGVVDKSSKPPNFDEALGNKPSLYLDHQIRLEFLHLINTHITAWVRDDAVIHRHIRVPMYPQVGTLD